MLYITLTQIANLKDITLRAIEVLKEVDLISAEDTRHTRILTKHYDIDTPLTSYFEHNKFKKSEYLLKVLQEGKSVALVTDTGTPGISDPGYRLIKLAQENNIPITVVPGACALVAGLSLSGLPTDSFVFEGFLPNKSSARRKKLEALKDQKLTIIFYESPHLITMALKDIEEVLGNPVVACARELTKKFEELRKGTAAELYEHFSRTNPKGEFVLMLNLKRE